MKEGIRPKVLFITGSFSELALVTKGIVVTVYIIVSAVQCSKAVLSFLHQI